jgi:threonine dehydratase
MVTYAVTLRAMTMQESYIERILKARVYDVAIESPLEPARRLSRRLGNDVLFKREDLQPVFSFKLRAAVAWSARRPATTRRVSRSRRGGAASSPSS